VFDKFVDKFEFLLIPAEARRPDVERSKHWTPDFSRDPKERVSICQVIYRTVH